MLKRLSFGQYKHKDSLIHKLDPRIKIISIAILSASAFLISSYYKMALLSLLVLLLIAIAKINFSSLIRNIMPLSSIIIFILIMYLLFSRDQLGNGILSIWRFLLFVAIALILTFTTTINSMVAGIEKMLGPLKYFKVNPRTFALLISLTIRFIPSFFLYAERIRDARLSRLGNLKKAKHIKLLFIPLLDRVFKSASTISDAMAARSYTAERKSYFKDIRLGDFDYFSLLVLMAAVSVILI